MNPNLFTKLDQPYKRQKIALSNYRGAYSTRVKRTATAPDLPNKRIRLSPANNIATVKKSRMPLKYRRRRTNRRRRGRIFRRRRIASQVSPYKLIKTKIMQTWNTTGTTTLSTAQVSMTNGNDVLGGLSNRQDLNYDAWANLYSKAKVLGTRVWIRAHNAGASSVVVGICPRKPGQTAALTDWHVYASTKGCKYRILSPDIDKGGIMSKVGTKKWFSLNNLKDCDDLAYNLDGSSTGPTLSSFFDIFCQSWDKTDSFDIELTITVEQIVYMYNAKTQTSIPTHS